MHWCWYIMYIDSNKSSDDKFCNCTILQIASQKQKIGIACVYCVHVWFRCAKTITIHTRKKNHHSDKLWWYSSSLLNWWSYLQWLGHEFIHCHWQNIDCLNFSQHVDLFLMKEKKNSNNENVHRCFFSFIFVGVRDSLLAVYIMNMPGNIFSF